MRLVRVDEVGERRVETAMVHRAAGQAGGGEGDAVIAVHPADDLLLVVPAESVVVVPDDLDRGIVRFRAGIVEEHLGHRHRHLGDQLLGQIDARQMRLVREGMIVGQGVELLHGSLFQALGIEAQRCRPEAGHALDIFLSGIIVDIDAFTPVNDHRTLFFMGLEVRVGMQHICDVTRRR